MVSKATHHIYYSTMHNQARRHRRQSIYRGSKVSKFQKCCLNPVSQNPANRVFGGLFEVVSLGLGGSCRLCMENLSSRRLEHKGTYRARLWLVQLAACSLQLVACAACSLWLAACGLQLVACSLWLAACGLRLVQLAACGLVGKFLPGVGKCNPVFPKACQCIPVL